MKLTGLHFLLTYKCTYECDHCFVFGSPAHSGAMTLPEVLRVLREAKDLGTVTSIYFEGGEPFLYYALLARCVREAAAQGFDVGIVSNAYWALSEEDALEALSPFEGLLKDLSVSSDLFHASELMSAQARHARAAAARLDIPCGVITINRPDAGGEASTGQIPQGESSVMYRGRAALELVPHATPPEDQRFDACPHEDFREPGRLHLDCDGNLFACQGIVIGSLANGSLRKAIEAYDPDSHPIVAPLMKGGPDELARVHGIELAGPHADACHRCFEVRRRLVERYPEWLAPALVYGLPC